MLNNLSEKQINKLQEFYDGWVKPLKHLMPSQLLEEWEKIVIEYNLND